MASRATEEAISSYLATNWTACPIYLENDKGTAPSDGSPFLMLTFPVANVRRLTISAPAVNREDGAFRIVINVRRGKGVEQIRLWGEQLAALFRGRKIASVHCLAPSEPATDDRSDAGNYYSGAMVVPFWRTFRNT